MSHCTICLETTKDPFQSKCSHSFCNKCIMQWITQHDDCPLCRNPISDTPTIDGSCDDEENQIRDHYIIFRNYYTLPEQEEQEIDNRLEDFIDTIDEDLSVYKWKVSNEGSYYTRIRKQNYCIDIKIYMGPSHFNSGSIFDKLHNIYVSIHKREFYSTKQSKYKNKRIKLNKFRNKAYLFR